jgi:hypothetical protein
MSNIVQYGKYEVEAAAEEQEELDKLTSGTFYKLKVGRNVLRFLPPKLGMRSPYVKVHQHFIRLPGMENPVTFNCPRMMAKSPCPACQKVDQLRSTGNPADYAAAGDLLPQFRVYANVIDKKAPEAGPQILAYGKKIHEALVQLRRDEDAGGDYTDPIEGFDIVITRTGTGKNDTSYQVAPARHSTKLEDMEWIALQGDISRYGMVQSYDQIVVTLQKAGIGADTGEPEPRRPNRSKSRSRKAEDDAYDVDAE